MTHLIDIDELITMQTGYVAAIKQYNLPEDAAELETAEKDLAILVDLKSRVVPTTLGTTPVGVRSKSESEAA